MVVTESDGRTQVVVPSPELQRDLSKCFHDENGHLGAHPRYFHLLPLARSPLHHKLTVMISACCAAVTCFPGTFATRTTLRLDRLLRVAQCNAAVTVKSHGRRGHVMSHILRAVRDRAWCSLAEPAQYC